MKVIYAKNQSDFTTAASEIIAEDIISIREARHIIRSRLGVRRLSRQRAWAAAPDVIEAWAESIDPECDTAYCIVADD